MPLLQHLHLHVRDRPRAEAFYVDWFGLRVERRAGALSFLRDANDFLLVLMDDPAPAPLPDWFHFGFAQPSPDAVAALHDRMAAAGVPIVRPLARSDAITAFRCADADGWTIEVYWLPG